jgi:hypothetical protein
VTTQPNGRIAADRTASDAAPLVPTGPIPTGPIPTGPIPTGPIPTGPIPTAATPTRPADHVTAREIAEFLHHLTRFRSPALGGEPADHAALLARKAELLRRIADQHARTTAGPPPATAPTTPTTPTPPEGHTP